MDINECLRVIVGIGGQVAAARATAAHGYLEGPQALPSKGPQGNGLGPVLSPLVPLSWVQAWCLITQRATQVPRSSLTVLVMPAATTGQQEASPSPHRHRLLVLFYFVNCLSESTLDGFDSQAPPREPL